MKIEIGKNDILSEGEYELTDNNKLENARLNFTLPPSDRQVLIEYDRIAGRIVKDGTVLPPQSLYKLEVSRPIEKYSDEELQVIIRRAENTDIGGSLYQRASNEWKLRQDIKLAEANTKKKWRHDYLPVGYPKDCSDDQIRQVVQDLSEEKHNKLQGGKNNKIWEKVIDDAISNGRGELTQRKETRYWYEKPVGIFFLGVLTTVVAGYILFRLGWI